MVNVFIQVWPDDSATLLLADGTSLFTYQSLDDAMAVCREWLGQAGTAGHGGAQDPTCASFY